MDRATEMAILVAAVDRGGFTAAAEHVGLTPSAISKAIARLEGRLGVRLLERTTRRIALTAEGRTYYEAARAILGAIDDAEATVMEGRSRPRGTLRINAGASFALMQLVPALATFRAACPEVTIDLAIEDRIADVFAEDIDVAIRTGPIGDDRLVARRLTYVRRVIVASPTYLAAHGSPRVPADLSRHACIPIATSPQMALWPFHTADGIRQVEVTGPIRVGSAEAAHTLAVAGLGIARVGDVVAARSLHRGDLVALLEDSHAAEPVPIHLVFQPGRQRLPRVRAFIDFAMERFGQGLWTVDPERQV